MLFKASGNQYGFIAGLFLWSLAPYVFGHYVLAKVVRAPIAAMFVVGCLVGDLYMHRSVFIHPRGSTAALGLLFMPIWNLMVIGPAMALLTWLALFAASRRRQTAT